MKNIIAVGTGLVYKFFDDQESRIKRLRNINSDGIELCIANSDDLLNLSLSDETINYLRSLKHISIHSPWIGVEYGFNDRSRKVLNKIEKICYDIGAKNVIVHDSHIKEHEIYNEYSFKTLIENDDYKVEEFSNPKKFQEVLDSYPNLGFNFDFAHALTIGNDIVKKFIDNFKDRIFQVHMSNLTRDIKDHNFLYRDGTPETLELLEYFAEKINAPLVLECVASKEEEIDLIQKEIDFLRNFYD